MKEIDFLALRGKKRGAEMNVALETLSVLRAAVLEQHQWSVTILVVLTSRLPK